MNVSTNPDWARFKVLGIARLGYAGFADWLEYAAHQIRAEPQRLSNMQPHRCDHGVFCPHYDNSR